MECRPFQTFWIDANVQMCPSTNWILWDFNFFFFSINDYGPIDEKIKTFTICGGLQYF